MFLGYLLHVCVFVGGYILRRAPEYPRSSMSGYVREHRLVVELREGRYLKPDEVVHHKNIGAPDNKINNVSSNLQLCSSEEEHNLIHYLYVEKIKNERRMRECGSIDAKRCPSCGECFQINEMHCDGRGYPDYCNPCYQVVRANYHKERRRIDEDYVRQNNESKRVYYRRHPEYSIHLTLCGQLRRDGNFEELLKVQSQWKQNKADRECNLMAVDLLEEGDRIKKQIRNCSGFRGVVWDKERGRWRAQIGVERKKINLGRFDNKEEAAHVYDEAAIKYQGEFAVLNFQRTL